MTTQHKCDWDVDGPPCKKPAPHHRPFSTGVFLSIYIKTGLVVRGEWWCNEHWDLLYLGKHGQLFETVPDPEYKPSPLVEWDKLSEAEKVEHLDLIRDTLEKYRQMKKKKEVEVMELQR